MPKGLEGEACSEALSTLLCLRNFPGKRTEVDKRLASCHYGRDRSQGLSLLFKY